MRRAIYIFIILLFFAGCNKKSTLNVVSFHTGTQNDSPNKWENRFPLIQNFFKSEKFDIVGLQNVNPEKSSIIEELLIDYNYIKANNTSNGNNSVPIFFKKNKFNLLSWSQFWLSENSDNTNNCDEKSLKLVTWVKLQNTKTGHIFFVFNTNFCKDNEGSQIESTFLLLQKIHEIAGNAPVIVTGNFHFDKSSTPYKILTSNWNRFLSLQNGSNIIRGHKTVNTGTFNNYSRTIPHIKTDYILINSYLSIASYKTHKIAKKEVYISDYFPVSAKIQFLFDRKPRTGSLIEVPWINHE